MIVCYVCGLGPLDRRSLYRDNGALFHKGKSIRGIGPLFCAACAPVRIRNAVCANWRIDPEMRKLAQGGIND